MGKLIRGWALVDQVLGPYLAGRLRNQKPVDIAACNGQIYRLDPKSQQLINLTTHESYCVHPLDGNDYCFPDMVVLWWDYIHLKVEEIERVVGGPDDGHRRPWFDGESRFGTCIEPRSFSTDGRVSASIENAKAGVEFALQDPQRFISMMPPSFRRGMDIGMSTVMDFYSRGLLSTSFEIKEVVENEEVLEDDSKGEDRENAECAQDGIG